MMEMHEFRDTLKKLSFVDKQDWMSDATWAAFTADPVRSFIKADDETADRLWNLICPTEGVIAEDMVTDLAQSARMIRTWIPDVYPANALGQVSFARAVMESVATVIEQAIEKRQIREPEA
jgi:hypothetical protein